MKHANFLHLHVHSQYSLMQSAIQIDELLIKARSFKIPALALTDRNNMFGAIEFYKKALRHGVKPIVGCELDVMNQDRYGISIYEEVYPIVLLAINRKGYKNLVKLVSMANMTLPVSSEHKACIDKNILEEYSEDLIVLSGGSSGEISDAIARGDSGKACKIADAYKSIFSDTRFYLELQHGQPETYEKTNQGLIELSRKLSIPVVATNNVYYLSPSDGSAQETLLAMRAEETTSVKKYNNHCFCSPRAMTKNFGHFPEALDNTIAIAERVNLDMEFYTKEFGSHPSKKHRQSQVPHVKKRTMDDLINKYTPFGAAAIIQFSSYSIKQLVLSLATALNISADHLAPLLDLLPEDENRSLGEAMKSIPALKHMLHEERFLSLYSVLNRLAGKVLHYSISEGQAVISNELLFEDIPLFWDDSCNHYVSQYSAGWLSDLGLEVVSVR